MDGVQGYDEDQIVLAIMDESKFAEQIPIILGTPTIGHVVNVMMERGIDALAMPWAIARLVHLLSVHRAAATVMEDQTLENADQIAYNEVVFIRNTETTEAFSSHIISMEVEKAYTGECNNIMTQTLWTEDGSLPQGLTVQNAYTELQRGRKYVVIVVRNSMAYPQMLQKKAPVGQSSSYDCSAGNTTRD